MELTIAETILIDILIVGRPVELEFLCGLPNQSHLTAGFRRLVILIVEILVVDKALQAAIEASHRKGELLRRTVMMSHFDIAIQAVADAQTDVGTLIVHRILRVDAHKAALSVLSVERALRTTQDVHTVQHIEMVIKGRFRHQRDIVVIEAHGRAVDTGADAAYIHRRGEARTIARHYKRRDILRELTQVADVELLELLTAEDIAAQGLQAQPDLLFRLRHNHHFI